MGVSLIVLGVFLLIAGGFTLQALKIYRQNRQLLLL